MGLRHDVVAKGLKAARHIAGDDANTSAAITAATLANTADRLLGGTRKRTAAIRDALAEDRVDNSKRPSADAEPPAAESLESLSAKADAQPDAGEKLKALLGGAVASFKRGVETPPDREVGEAIGRVADSVKGTSLVIIGKAHELAALAPEMPRTLGMGWRFIRSESSADDVAALIAHVKHKDGMISGYLKRKGFDQLLARMKDTPDMRIFEALDAFSNNAEERHKALRSISNALRDAHVPPDIASTVISGFKLMNGKDDVKAQLLALDLLAKNKHLETRFHGAEIVETVWTDEAIRHRALTTLAAGYNGMTAAEIVAFLKLFPSEPARQKAAKVLRPKLTDPQNVGEIDSLFSAPKTIKSISVDEFPELARVKSAGARLFGSFMQGVRGTK